MALTAKQVREHLVEVPEAWTAAKRELFGVDAPRESLRICGLKRILKQLDLKQVVVKPRIPDPGPLAERLPVLSRLDSVVHTAKPRSLEHLKELVGVPNSALKAAERIAPMPVAAAPRQERSKLDSLAEFGGRMAPLPVELRHLPTTKKITFKRLNANQRVAVRNQAFNLIYGYADAEMVERPPLAAIRDYVLNEARALPVLVLDDLVVCDGEVVEFNGFSSLYFNNVLVEGSGEIRMGSFTKLHAYAVKRV
jgi:hypothetical protein